MIGLPGLLYGCRYVLVFLMMLVGLAVSGFFAGGGAEAGPALRAAVGGGTPSVTPTPLVCTDSWEVVSSPNRGQLNALNATEFAAPDNGWAVGSYLPVAGGPERTLIEHWDGNAWTVTTSPNPSASLNELRGISVLSSTNTWAVGITSISHSLDELALTWNGASWTYSGTPGSKSNSNELMDVVALAPNNVWAIGTYYISFYRPYGLHWDGSTWTHIDMPLIGSNLQHLQKMGAAGPNDIWAAGYYRGDFQDTRYFPFMQHWDGTTWDLVPVPSPASYTNVLMGVDPVRDTSAGNTAWAVGWHTNFFGDAARTFAIRWNGTSWTTVPSPIAGQGSNQLLQVLALADNDVWAAGSYEPTSGAPNRTLVMHWDGSSWTIVPSQNLGNDENVLSDITVAGNTLWAVGHYNDGSGNQSTLIERYDRRCPFPTASPTYTSTGTRTPTPTPSNTSTSTNTPTATYTSTSTPTSTATRTPTSTSTATNTPSSSATATQTYTPSSTATATNTSTSRPTSTTTGTSISTGTSTSQPSATTPPTRLPTPTATPTRATACSITFTDVQPSDFFYDPVRYLYCRGVISGYGDNTFRPYNTTTRGQVTKIVVLGFGIHFYVPSTPTFTDVPITDPFYTHIETAAHYGIVSGYSDGTFRPSNNVTRGQLSKMVVNAAGWALLNPSAPSFSDVLPRSTFYEYVETAYARGIISGYNDRTFRPSNSATRGQICKIVYQATMP
jgi:hypothetical protein